MLITNYAIANPQADSEPSADGNFALPTSQQPGPFLSFGQNILDDHQIQLTMLASKSLGNAQQFTSYTPGYLYQATDATSLLFSVPIAAANHSAGTYSAGIGDASLQLEHVIYSTSNTQYTDLGTVVINMSLPSGSATKQPSTGLGSPSFFGGFTFNRMYNSWFGFTSEGVTLTTLHQETKFGNTFLYQFGLGKNIFSQYQNIIVDEIFELDGAYNQKSRIDGLIDSDSGGNVINFIPSIWISSLNYIFQLGVGFPIVQHLNGNQLKMNYLVAANLAYTLR